VKHASVIAAIVVSSAPFLVSANESMIKQYEKAGWKVVESTSFRVHQSSAFVEKALIEDLEQHRTVLQAKWQGGSTGRTWDPKCDIFIYATPAEFEKETRRSAETLACTLLEVGEGRVWMRRVSVRGDVGLDFDQVLKHEVTHVVLADVFRDFQIPRWLDEGIAVAEEQSSRRRQINQQLLEAVEVSRHADLSDLLCMSRFPADRTRADVLYAQSASLVEFLLTKKSPVVLVNFAKCCRTQSLEESMRRHFGFDSMEQAERAWLDWTIESAETAVADRE
jgi:hypothetical protein